MSNNQKIFIASKANITKTAEYINDGKLVCFPTDTLYSLSADATNTHSVAQIYKTKKREQGKPLAVLVENINQACEIAEFNNLALELAKKFWPGALTIILPYKKTAGLCPDIISKDGNIALRIPDSTIALDILKHTKKPLISTSANISGADNILNPEIIKQEIGDNLSIILINDINKTSGTASTIVDLTQNEIKIIRQGSVFI